MRKTIIDTDPGHDDAIAIMTALANNDQIEILGITTVAGNQTLDKVTDNILRLEEVLNVDIPVARGFDRPLVKPLDVQPQAHGESGIDGYDFPETDKKAIDMHAVEFMKETVEKEDKITLVAIGPLTNVAVFLRMYPHLISKIDSVVIMGGSVYAGNILRRAEFNIYHDPEAAKIVFGSGAKVVMCGLEVCYSASILFTEIEEFKGQGKISDMFYGLMKFYSGYAIRKGWDRTAIFDATTIIWLLHPEYFEVKEMAVDVELNGKHTQGMTVCDEVWHGDIVPATVLLSADREKYVQVIRDAIHTLDERAA